MRIYNPDRLNTPPNEFDNWEAFFDEVRERGGNRESLLAMLLTNNPKFRGRGRDNPMLVRLMRSIYGRGGNLPD